MIKTIRVSLGFLFLVVFLLMAAVFVRAGEPGPGDEFTTGPSNHCHSTDGMFTSCADGNMEWSDIRASFFDVFADLAGPESALYVDQADMDPTRSIPNGSGIDTLMLMYDEMLRTTPLGPSETVHVHFMTVDSGEIVHYDVWIGTGGIQKVEIDGVLQDPMPSGLRGIAGYGLSPNSATPHVMAELQIGLEAAGFTSEECCYSPDPAWWGSDVPQDPKCLDDGQIDGNGGLVDQNGHQDRCIPGEPVSTTAGIFTANPDGSTTVDPEPLLPVGDEPPQAACIESVNPHGQTIPPAGRTTLPGPRGGQNEDGYYILKAEDAAGLPLPIEILSLSLVGGPFGPYPSGTTVKITEAPGVTPMVTKIGSTNGKAGAVTDHIILDADALMIATDADGDRIALRCLVPPPPK